jgi:hypothetical protein
MRVSSALVVATCGGVTWLSLSLRLVHAVLACRHAAALESHSTVGPWARPHIGILRNAYWMTAPWYGRVRLTEEAQFEGGLGHVTLSSLASSSGPADEVRQTASLTAFSTCCGRMDRVSSASVAS